MKLFRHIALSTLITVGAFTAVTYTACTKDSCSGVVCNNGGTCSGGSCVCPTGYTGTHCDTLLSALYTGTYKGNGSDNSGHSYTNWSLQFAGTTSNATALTLNILDDNNLPQLAFTVHLSTNTTFTVDAKSTTNFDYTGTGSIDGSSASLTLTETAKSGGASTVYTFNNMLKQ